MFSLTRPLAATITTGTMLLMIAACGQNYSEKEADGALAERGLVPLREQADPHAGATAVAAQVSEGQVQIGHLVATPPNGWVSETPSSTMRAAQYSVNGAELAVFEGTWGTVDENVGRWVGQFSQPDGSSTEAKTKRWEVRSQGGISITMVDIPGTYGGGMGGGSAQDDYRMLGAIVPAAGTFYYLKFTGPDAVIETQREAFDAFVKSLSTS
ncbi:MAG: hypothetical protein HN712_25635 [Gemmatimonadetes bacterium]|nr:hypothetical protein [Gemmatimonadota bacterium]MBT6146116.1 hypothetical protein [Gemmatimonadota bacterium]MBT7863724.1 hypothetical protein [Gemmatimonadota bacterium]